jgi:hypothetical protein
MQALAPLTYDDKRLFYGFEPHLERCKCGLQILWYELRVTHSASTVSIKKPNGKDNAKRRFKCCCVCAEKEARPWRRKHGTTISNHRGS